jgi:hypothetical protein
MHWLCALALVLALDPVGQVAWVEGTVTITRAGE